MRYNIIKKILYINIQLEKRRVGGLLRLTLCNVQIMCTINFNNNKCTIIRHYAFVIVFFLSRTCLFMSLTYREWR